MKPTRWAWASAMTNCATICTRERSARCCFPAATSSASRPTSSMSSQFNMGVPQFEQEVKAEIAQHKLLAAVGAAVTVSDKDIREELKRQDTKVKFEYAVLSLDDVKKQIKPTDAELKAFLRPEQAAVRQLHPGEDQGEVHPDRHQERRAAGRDHAGGIAAVLQPASGRLSHPGNGDGAPHPDQDADAGCQWQSRPESRRRRARQGGRHREAVEGGREFRRPGEEVFRGSGQREGRRTAAADHARPHGAGIRAGGFQYSGRDRRRA